MGHAKRMLEAMEERLFIPSSDRACKHHVHEEWLRSRLESIQSDVPCVVCGAMGTRQVDLDALFDLVVATIRQNWRHAIDDLFLDCESESGFAGAAVRDTADLVRGEMYTDLDEGLLELVAKQLVEEQWYDPAEIWLEGSELLSISWHQFSEWSREHVGPLVSLASYEPSYAEAADGIPPDQMLARLKEIIDEFVLVIERDVPWFRACHLGFDEAPSAARLGAAPEDRATQSNRNSPAGVPMFYGSVDPGTARQEIGETEPGSNRLLVVGKWKATRPLVLLDLTVEREFPSFHDVEQSSARQGLRFLQEFAYEVSRPLGSADPDVAYRPTQALTAFMRDAIKGLDGIVYRSSRTGRDCCTLFVSNEQCVDDAPLTADLAMVLLSIDASR